MVADINLKYARTADEARYFRDKGYEPVECAFGPESVVGPLGLDHHGPLSHREPVSSRAAQLASLGERTNKVVVAGGADPDAVLAILAITGSIPIHAPLVRAIALEDRDPIGIDRIRLADHLPILAFDAMYQPFSSNTPEGYEQALEIGLKVFTGRPLDDASREKAIRYEQSRRREILAASKDRSLWTMLVATEGPSRDVVHETAAPIMIQWKPRSQVLTFSGCTVEGAERINRRGFQYQTPTVYDLLGQDGLNVVYEDPAIKEIFGGKQCGGRPDIGGSPRDFKADYEHARQAYIAINALVERDLPKRPLLPRAA